MIANFVKHLKRSAKAETRKPALSTKRNAKRLTNHMIANFVKHLKRSAKAETRKPAIFTKRNAKRMTNHIIANFVKHLKRSAKAEIRKPAIFTKRNAKRFGFTDWLQELGHITYPDLFNEKSKETIASECKMNKKHATYF